MEIMIFTYPTDDHRHAALVADSCRWVGVPAGEAHALTNAIVTEALMRLTNPKRDPVGELKEMVKALDSAKEVILAEGLQRQIEEQAARDCPVHGKAAQYKDAFGMEDYTL